MSADNIIYAWSNLNVPINQQMGNMHLMPNQCRYCDLGTSGLHMLPSVVPKWCQALCPNSAKCCAQMVPS